MRNFLFGIVFSFLAFSVSGQENAAVRAFIQDTLFRHAQVTFAVREVADNETVASFDAQKACVPASVTKLITTATAIEVLGPDYRFKTTLEINGEIDSTGCLQGDLFIAGNGDPTIGSRHFESGGFAQEWVAELKKRGISRINGNVVVDVSVYDNNPISMLWLREDIGIYYGAGVYPVSVFDNTASVSLKSGKSGSVPEVTKTVPDVGYNYIVNLEVTSSSKDSVYLVGDPYSANRYLYGSMRENSTKTVKGDISDPPHFLAQYFVQKAKGAGLEITGDVAVLPTKTSGEREVVHTHYSPELIKIIRQINVTSNNNYAEHVLKHLGLQVDSTGKFDSALKFVRSFWKEKGLDVSGLFLYDGSGLSPKNAFPADFLCDLLVYMQKESKHADAFYMSLPIAGETGTVASFLKDTRLSGNARVKSGSFRNVQCYSGYINKGGKRYAFCVMVNNFNGERRKVVRAIEKLLTAL